MWRSSMKRVGLGTTKGRWCQSQKQNRNLTGNQGPVSKRGLHVMLCGTEAIFFRPSRGGPWLASAYQAGVCCCSSPTGQMKLMHIPGRSQRATLDDRERLTWNADLQRRGF